MPEFFFESLSFPFVFKKMKKHHYSDLDFGVFCLVESEALHD